MINDKWKGEERRGEITNYICVCKIVFKIQYITFMLIVLITCTIT
jgi:hypothetical protein